MDDLLFVRKDTIVARVKGQLSKLLTVSDLGMCKHFVEMRLINGPNGILYSQSAFTELILASAKKSDSKPVGTPLPLCHTLYGERASASEVDRRQMATVPYRKFLGSLIYLSTRTRPDIATADSILGKFQADPVLDDWKALKHLLRYLKGTVRSGIIIPHRRTESRFEAYSDAAWAREERSRRSRSDVVIFNNATPVVWLSKLQQAMATSTSEAEFSALSTCAKDVAWLWEVLSEIGFPEGEATGVHQDNLCCINWTESVQGLRNVKHVGIRYHYVRYLVHRGIIRVQYVQSDLIKADALTNVLGKVLHSVHMTSLGLSNV